MLLFDDVDYVSLDETFSEGGILFDVIVGIPGKNGGRANAPADEADNYHDGVLISMSSKLTILATG